MFIAIVGTRFSGKATVENYLVAEKGFTPVKLVPRDADSKPAHEEDISITTITQTFGSSLSLQSNAAHRKGSGHESLVSVITGPRHSPTPVTTNGHVPSKQALCFSSPKDLLNYITINWRQNFVTRDLNTKALVDRFIRRPFFMLISLDAPLLDRFQRSTRSRTRGLEDFIREDDQLVFGAPSPASSPRSPSGSTLNDLRDSINIHIFNTFTSVAGFHSHLEALDLLNSEHLRPSWDSYFMTLASLASRRSNCMKRRVGAVLVRDNRIIATGYNGTPRGLNNCSQGGCFHCNGTSPGPGILVECVCLHAEENALLEAGRERIGKNAVLYCNTCPCLKCTVKIIQTGVKTVVYNLTYKMDNASAQLFQESGVALRRYDPSTSFPLPPGDDETSVIAAI